MKKLAKAMVVPVRQRTQYTCVPCSLSMCLRALGLDWIDEDTVNDVMGARPMKGATWEQVLATAQHFGKRGTLTSPCTIEQLKEWTDQGIPVMIAYNPEGRDWSHASVVFHVDSDTVYVADPNIPDPSEFVREFSWKEFYGVWYEKWPNYLVRRPAMAISHEISESGQQVPHPNLRMAMKKTAHSDYMSKQNIRDSLRMCKDLVLWVDGENMEDWVEDKLSVIRAALSDVHRFYENGMWDIGKKKITLWVDENMRKASVDRVANRFQSQRSRRDLQDEINEGIEEGENLSWTGNRPTHVAVGGWEFHISAELENQFEMATGLSWDDSPSSGLRHHPALTWLMQKYGERHYDGKLVPLKGKKYLIASMESEYILFENDRRWQKSMGRLCVVNASYGGFGLSDEAKALYAQLGGKKDLWNINRTDPVLIRVIEKLGSKRASGRHAQLKVVPLTGRKFYVMEYDGLERLYTEKDMIVVR